MAVGATGLEMKTVVAIGTGLVPTFLGLAGFVAALWAFWRQSRDSLPVATPTAQERAEAAEELWSLYPAFPDDEPDTALFLLEESRREYDGWVASNERIEGKATWLTGFLAGGAGLLTVFGNARGDKSHVDPGPFLFLAIIAAFGAVLCCLYLVRTKFRLHPSTSAYVSPLTAYVSKSRFHIALSLAEEYNRASIDLARRRRFDPVAWTVAQGSLMLAVFAILVHFGSHLEGHVPGKAVVNCRVQSGSFHTGTAFKASCEEQQDVR
ncbi:MAG: hypothetical protein JO036_00955 [Candidatus Eremiobacteraeota bacterium]|nr:hypothetical protein [Candidatus Eremiobacteraeota bacterium]